jgi:hypothetical protein
MILQFDKPKKLRATTAHNAMHSSDTGIPGTYVPNMSKKNREAWKAKIIGGADPRVEIRKTVTGNDPTLKRPSTSAQMLLIVRLDGSVIMSANSRLAFDAKTLQALADAVDEAKNELWRFTAGKKHKEK